MKKLLSTLWPLVIAALGTAALAWVYWDGWNIHPHANASELGQLGDFFGGLLNPLVSALTLFVAISVWRLQKDELELTRNEMTQTKLAMEEQAKTAEQQRQEQRFFDLLEVYQQTMRSVEIGGSTGKAAFMNWRKLETGLIHDLVHNTERWQKMDIPIDRIQQLRRSWSDFSPNFDHYFRVVFRILYEMESLLGEQQYRYAKLFRAQLATEELNLIGLNLWLDEEADRMRPAAEKYGLLKHLQKGPIRTELEEALPANTFGRSWAKKIAAQKQSNTHQ